MDAALIFRLEPPIELDTPKGRGWAVFFRDYGYDHDDLWTVCINETREFWTFRNNEVLAVANETFGRKTKLSGAEAIAQQMGKVAEYNAYQNLKSGFNGA